MNWALVAELLIRSTVVLVACEALRRLVARPDAAQRYRIGLVGFAMLATLPLLSAVLPPMHLPLGNWLHREGIVTVVTGSMVATRAASGHGAGARFDWPFVIWCLGVAPGLGWLIAGKAAIWRLARKAESLREEQFLKLVEETRHAMGLRHAPEVLIFKGAMLPVTFGILRPRILLPAESARWTEVRWRVVLLHELAHIKRRDVAGQLLANVASVLWWFQPLAWRARRRLRQESERACDAQAVALGIRASEYAAELVAIARGSRWRGATSGAAISMASGRLEGRVQAILSQKGGARRTRALPGILALVLCGTAASAIDVGGSPMKRTILSGLLASAGLSAATLGGSIMDQSGAAVADAKIVLSNPDTAVQQEMASAPDGKFSFESLPAGQYILRIDKAGYAAVFREFTLDANAKVERGMTMNLESAQKPIQVKGEVAGANLIVRPHPEYPAAAKAAGAQGTVVLKTVIEKNGIPGEITLVSSPNTDLTEAAINAVRQWRYRPTLLNGQPVAVETDVFVNFTLSK